MRIYFIALMLILSQSFSFAQAMGGLGKKSQDILPADSVGENAYLPSTKLLQKGMHLSEIISIFGRQPDYISKNGLTYGWMYTLEEGKKVFSVRLTFDAKLLYLGRTDEGLAVHLFKNEY